MTNEEKIARLGNLFRQKDQIDGAILEILSEQTGYTRIAVVKPVEEIFPVMKRKGRKPKAEKPAKEKRVYRKRAFRMASNLKTTLPAQYRCQDCEEEFISERPPLDVICPTCNSVHVKKSTF